MGGVSLKDVAFCLVTRGDVPISPILDSLPDFAEVIVWDNSNRADRAVFGRFDAAMEAESAFVFFQDDDVLLPPESIEEILAAQTPGKIVCNQPAEFRHEFYEDHSLLGFGSCCEWELPWEKFRRLYPMLGDNDWPWFYRTCDVALTCLSKRVLVDVPKVNREFAEDANRMYRQPGHVEERQRMLELARKVRDGR